MSHNKDVYKIECSCNGVIDATFIFTRSDYYDVWYLASNYAKDKK